MIERKKISMDGNTSAAHVSYAFTDVAAIFPITPSSVMAEATDEWATQGKKNLFGDVVKVGAGTVLTEEQLMICEDAGGEYMVTPNVNVDLIKKCVADGLMAMPGALTPTEAVTAYNAGASYVKLFPIGVLGPEYVKAVMAPLSHIPAF